MQLFKLMCIRPHKINSLVLRPNFPKLDEGGRLFFFFFIVKKTDEGGFFLFGKEINYLQFKKNKIFFIQAAVLLFNKDSY